MPKPLRAPYRSELRAHSNQIGPTCAATNTPSPSPVSSATPMPRIVAQRNPVAPTTCQHVVALWHDYVLTGAELALPDDEGEGARCADQVGDVGVAELAAVVGDGDGLRRRRCGLRGGEAGDA